MSTYLENPADKLSTIIIRLFDLGGDTRIKPKTKRNALRLAAHRLHGYSMTLAQIQFKNNSANYTEAMKEIKKVNSDLKQAKDDIDKIVKTVKGISKLVSSVEKIIIAVGGAVV